MKSALCKKCNLVIVYLNVNVHLRMPYFELILSTGYSMYPKILTPFTRKKRKCHKVILCIPRDSTVEICLSGQF